MDTEEFSKLIARYNNNTASAEERMQVERWYEQLEGKAILSEDAELKGQIYGAVRKHIEEPAPVLHKKERKIYTWIAWAAVWCVLFNIGLLYFQAKRFQVSSDTFSVQKKGITPGTDKAILTLANGTKINLSDVGAGQLAEQAGVTVSKTKNGELIYKVIGDNQATTKYNTISTPRGGQYQLLLADGTRIWLNANSSLTFPTSFPADKRKVKFKGEAYFEVAKDKSRRFIVESNETEVQVLGTHFNIMAYDDEAAQITTLLEGSIELRKGNEKSLLKPGQQARTMGATNQINVKDIENPEQVIAWKNGYLQFEKSDLQSLMRQVSRWYDADVVYQGKIPKKEYSGKIPRSVGVKTLIEMLSYSGIHCQVKDNKIIINL
ncbi:FecR family protein [Pedobacter cryoconitis]|uniref:Ferric-dicitrate binding protein FerR (Iron transport regulator) n=1 Tax=Pedobacter cryoconitis TaxID=188932 RepID=A0A7X0J6W0_9SPHI|nr:FecR family protein [Pedobacter cryoconitis]MBB6502213.1 ferric-dicitrate binding protein FerR (iron transport regulator) [Pedobacter cryoconitis]